MIKTIADSPILASLIMLICTLFTYGGAVNLGFSGFTMAVPFMALWSYIAYHSPKLLKIVSAIIFIIICGFYGLKKTDNNIFHPANGMEITLNKDSCFDSYVSSDQKYVLISPSKTPKDCITGKNSMGGVYNSKVVSTGTKYTITRTGTSYANLGEQTIAYINDIDGEVYIFDLSRFNKADDSVLKQSDLRQPYLYYPSLLMYWPIFPIFIFTAFSR
jgi:hypothetical protein